jgi:rubredoxin
MKYKCPCGFIYDETVGDADNGIEPGTKWEDLPDDCECPVCGIAKDGFTQI